MMRMMVMERKVVLKLSLALLLVGLLIGAATGASDLGGRWGDFDHFRTRFPLVGAHRLTSCESCHRGGSFEGTPTRCSLCHDGSGFSAQTGKDIDHIRSSDDCDDCHLAMAWVPSRVDHGAVRGTCFHCHNDIDAQGKSPGHIVSSSDCELCHRTTTWLGARFNHSTISAVCISCHNGIDAQGKYPGHIDSSDNCEDCHNTRNWEDAQFNHSNITQTCASCHVDDMAFDHLPIGSQDCSECHNTRDWQDAEFDHSNITQTCASCHTDDMPRDHFTIGSRDCDECHDTTRWSNERFTHPPGDYPGDHAGNLDCTRCHQANNESINWPRLDLQPDCAGCHASDFDQEEHKRDENGQLNTVSGLRNCAGSCHVEKPRTGEHRTSASDW